MIALISLNTIIFIMLSFLHIYWALGGNWGMNAVLPTLSDGQQLIRPGFFAKMGIAAAMGLFALVAMGAGGFLPYTNPVYFKYATAVIGVIFALRAMGDFRYIGFFRKANGTHFARNDIRYYSPLSLFLAAGSFAIAFI